MKLCQFYTSAEARSSDLKKRFPVGARLGLLVGGKIVDITDRAAKHHDLNDPQHVGVLTAAIAGCDEWAAFRKELAGITADGGVDPSSVLFGPCVLRPSQYLDFYAFEQHVMTMRKKRNLDFIVPEWYEMPCYYNSNATSFLGDGMTAYFPKGEGKIDYECEMACIIGKPVRNATPEQAADAIVGYTVLNDLSSRERQTRVMPVNMGPAPGKDFGNVMGKYLVTKDEIPDLGACGMRAYVNGEQWTDGRYGTVHHSFESMVVFASTSRTFYPGDILGSGTVGTGCGAELGKFLNPGDKIKIEIDHMDFVENEVQHDS